MSEVLLAILLGILATGITLSSVVLMSKLFFKSPNLTVAILILLLVLAFSMLFYTT